jgi:PAS domain S-box-containing protein
MPDWPASEQREGLEAGVAAPRCDVTGSDQVATHTGSSHTSIDCLAEGDLLSGVQSQDDPVESATRIVHDASPQPVTDSGGERHLNIALLRERSLLATDLAFTITDPHQPDNPLVWVNPAFSRVTGYSLDESVGRNCRFLQGPGTDAGTVGQLRQEMAACRPVTLTLLNYRKDGTPFYNELSVSPVFDADHHLLAFVGVQADVTERVRIEGQRRQAHAAERTARRDAEAARLRLGLLAEATTQLAATLDVDETLQRLSDLIVPSLADWVMINLVDAQGSIDTTVAKHRFGRSDLVTRFTELVGQSLTDRSSTRRVLEGGDPVLLADGSIDRWQGFIDSDELTDLTVELGVRSVMCVPLVARRRRILGSVTFVSGPSGRRFDEEDLAVAADLGRRAGLTFDNARLYEHEHRVAETLQRSLLPHLPPVAGLAVAARYLPGDADADVGGDFYELLPLPDGSVGFAAGDVVGHDLTAAAAMGHLRGLLRACAWNSAEDGRTEPTEVLERVDRLVQGLDVVPLATLLYGRLVRPVVPGAAWEFSYANAGHPPPLLRHPDGSVEVLDAAQGVLLGVVEVPTRHSATVQLLPESTLVAFTDGLVERRDDSIDNGIARLVEVLGAAGGAGPDRIVDQLMATLGAERSDDTAVIAVHVPGPPD